jgi:multisubunit Na+/H+ antiporter MnhF subunit
MGFNQNSWIFGASGTLSSLAGRFFGVLWLAATVSLIAAGVGLLTNQTWWTSAAIIGAIVSLVAILPWWNTVTSGVKVGALLDVAILIGLLTPLKTWVFQVFKL